MEVVFSHRSEVGRVRRTNEDSVLCVADDGSGRGHLFVLADGMGGARAGEVASRMAVEIVAEVFRSSADGPLETLEQAIRRANRDILKASWEQAESHGMGTTCVAVAVRDNRVALASVGDSRAYKIREGYLWRLSHDHSAWAERVREEGYGASVSSTVGRNELTRALGVDTEVAPEMTETDVQAGDRLVLCSDGLWGLVTDPEILAVVSESTPADACAELVELANSRGGPDNISIVVAELRGERGVAQPEEGEAPPW